MSDLSLAEQDHLREALASAATIEKRLRVRAPKGTEIVFRALQEAMHVLRRIPDNERRWIRGGGRSAWPSFTLTDEEREAAYFQAQLGKEEGAVLIDDSLVDHAPVTPRDIAIMEDVFSVFRSLCIGSSVGRDWTLLWLLAGGGDRTPAEVGRKIKPRLGARTIKQRIDLQCTIIAAKLRFLMVPAGAKMGATKSTVK